MFVISYIYICYIFCVMTKSWTMSYFFFQWYDKETFARERKILLGLYKQVSYLKSEVLSLRVKLRI
jgi:hypothetical protein